MTLRNVQTAQRRLRAASERQQSAREELRQAITQARESGHTLAAIGEALGRTRQGVFDLLRR